MSRIETRTGRGKLCKLFTVGFDLASTVIAPDKPVVLRLDGYSVLVVDDT
jgi:hypothetical protein